MLLYKFILPLGLLASHSSAILLKVYPPDTSNPVSIPVTLGACRHFPFPVVKAEAVREDSDPPFTCHFYGGSLCDGSRVGVISSSNPSDTFSKGSALSVTCVPSWVTEPNAESNSESNSESPHQDLKRRSKL